MIESVSDYAICILDLDAKVCSWNWGAQRTFGYTAEEIMGHSFEKFAIEDDRLSGVPNWEIEQAKNAGAIHDEGWRNRKDGTKFWALVSITRMRDANGNEMGYAMVTRDLTERKRAEDRLKLANESLEKRIQDRTVKLTEALQIRDEFLSIASHELKNPLATMCLQLTLLGRHTNDFFNKIDFPETYKSANIKTIEKLTKAVSSCEKQSKRLVALIDQLLDLTRIRIGKIELHPELVDLAELADEIITRHKIEGAKLPEIKLIKPAHMVIGKWDRGRVEQIISNLLSNAIKYGDGKGIELAIAGDAETNIAQICMTDYGIGIPYDLQESIFDKFQRASEVRDITGLGLGLFIVKQIVEAHGGKVRVHSIAHKGSSFFVELPFSQTPDTKLTSIPQGVDAS